MNNLKCRNNQKGTTLGFIAMVAAGLGILLLSISSSMKINSHQMIHFDNMNRVYRLAETGLSTALGSLSVNPSTSAFGATVLVDGEGYYQNLVSLSSNPVAGGYYIVTSATRTEGGRNYSCKLHTYALVANIADYFAAVNSVLKLSPGIDARQGKIYSPNIVFYTDGAATTRVQKAEYVYSCAIDGLVQNDDPSTWVLGGITPNLVRINDSATEIPTQLPNLLTLPKVSDEELLRYKNIAELDGANHTQISDFRSFPHIFPPGYLGGIDGDDPYTAGHTNENTHHVYYSTETMKIGQADADGTIIHGQVIFVSEKDIEIHGNIFSAAIGDPLPGAGATNISSSTAHQAVFITPGNIIIKSDWQLSGSTTTLEGFLIAPNASLMADGTGGGANSNLSFKFNGAMILGAVQDEEPNNLPTQFDGTRTYEYMSSLKTNPPPYLPSLAEIYYSLEEISSSASLY